MMRVADVFFFFMSIFYLFIFSRNDCSQHRAKLIAHIKRIIRNSAF